MGKVYQKIELTANILIIVAALLFVGFLVHRYFFSNPGLKTPTVGSKISLSDVDLSKNDKNVLPVLQKGCHFCSESADFYKILVENAQGKNAHVIAVLPQEKRDAEEYLNGSGQIILRFDNLN